MKTLILSLVVFGVFTQQPQIVGKWQLIKQTSCIEGEIEMTEDEQGLVNDMNSRSGPTAQIIQFKENNNAIESTRIISKRKSYNSNAMLYKFDGESLFILDKRSRTIVETFTVEKISSDSLIISNSARACDTKVFLKVK
jgi:hypothetical protein